MNITVFQCCDSKQRELGEKSIRFAWSDETPNLDMPVSMGIEADWQIADVMIYNNASESPVKTIHFVFVYRGEKPERTEWEYAAYRASHPQQNLEIQFAEIGGNFIGWAAHISGTVPTAGQYLVRHGMDESSRSIISVEPWFSTSVDAFVNEDPSAPFERLYLTNHCVKVVEEAATVEAAVSA